MLLARLSGGHRPGHGQHLPGRARKERFAGAGDPVRRERCLLERDIQFLENLQDECAGNPRQQAVLEWGGADHPVLHEEEIRCRSLGEMSRGSANDRLVGPGFFRLAHGEPGSQQGAVGLHVGWKSPRSGAYPVRQQDPDPVPFRVHR